jgi:signal peptidase II
MRINVNVASVKGVFVLLCVLIVDQITKAFIVSRLALHETIPVFPGFNIVHVRNHGISFGMLSNGQMWQRLLIWGAVIFLILYLIRQFLTATHWIPSVCVGGVLGGALGNVADRAIHGAVIDFIDLYVKDLNILSLTVKEWHWPAFNVADSAIVVGVCCFALYSSRAGKSAGKRR